MYYLLNQTDQIIAADESLLALCGVSHIDELSSKIILGDTTFDLISEDKLMINNDQAYTISKTSLSSMLGEITLVNVEMADTVEAQNDITELIAEENILDEFTLDDIAEESTESVTPLDLDSDLISIRSDVNEDAISLEDDKSLENLLLEEDEVLISPDTGPIIIDIEKVSQEMGISHEDYNAFIDEYIDTALGLEADLQSDDRAKRADAITTLSQLSDVLHLPVVDKIIEQLSTASTDIQKEIIESFYTSLSRLTTQAPKEDTKQDTNEDTTLELFDMEMPIDEPDTPVDVKPETKVSENSFGTINLDDIKPIHFDFQLEEAARDLSLPVELIEEFVHDFIEQGHIETKKMLEAYEKGDLDAIQKIGHLLKGASSNLRINALSDTLYQIQFCEDPSKLEAYIKEYWGHFLSFEIQINALAK